MSRTYLNHVQSLAYFDPVPVLLKYRELELEVTDSVLPINVKRLRAPSLKAAREGREAALFAYGLRRVLDTPVFVAPVEDSDYDFVLRWETGAQRHYCPVQLKELVSAERNPRASLENLLRREARRPESETLLLVRINRSGKVDLTELPIDELGFRELWFLWQSSPDGKQWSILGDALTDPERYDFAYPVAGDNG